MRGDSKINRRGWIFVEAVVSLGLMSALAAVLFVGQARIVAGQRHFDDSRAAARQAESDLISLQSGQATASGTPPKVLADPSPVPAMAWARTSATVHGRPATIIGLIPTSPERAAP